MINAWHLIWIIPLSASMGAFIMALMAVNNSERITHDEYGVEYET